MISSCMISMKIGFISVGLVEFSWEGWVSTVS